MEDSPFRVAQRAPSRLEPAIDDIEAPKSLPVAFREKLRLDRSIKRILVQSL